MSLSLTDLQGDLQEYFSRIEEVLSGMDAVLARLESRVARLEQGVPAQGGAATLEQRVARLEGQLAAIADSLFDDGGPAAPPGSIAM